jgi:hypothetical protein
MLKISFTFLMCVLFLGCESRESSLQAIFEVTSKSENSNAYELSAKITQTYIVERNYIKVVFPEKPEVSEVEISSALTIAVVQPAFSDNPVNGASYLMCTIHNPNNIAALEMLNRCENILVSIASRFGASIKRVNS